MITRATPIETTICFYHISTFKLNPFGARRQCTRVPWVTFQNSQPENSFARCFQPYAPWLSRVRCPPKWMGTASARGIRGTSSCHTGPPLHTFHAVELSVMFVRVWICGDLWNVSRQAIHTSNQFQLKTESYLQKG